MEKNCMDWYEKLYIGKTAKKKSRSLIRSLEEGKRVLDLWVIMLPESEANQLELIPAWNLKFWRREAENARIVGIACSKEEAAELLVEMVQDVLSGTGGADLRAYFNVQGVFVKGEAVSG